MTPAPLSRLRPWWAALGLIAAVAIAIVVSARTATDYLWFRALGAGAVFRVSLGAQWAMFGIVGAFMALATGLSAALARRMRPSLAAGSRPPGLERRRLAVDLRWGRLLAAVVAVVGILSGLIGARSWATWLQFAHRTSFGRRDPQFHLDLSFFVFVYPFLRLVLAYVFVAVLLALVAAAVVHFLYGGLRFRPGDAQVTGAARAHLFILLGLFVLLKAAAYWLDRYGIDFSSRDVIATGASYTDVNAMLPAKTVLAAIALLCALLFFAGAARRGAMLPAVGFCLLVLSAILVGGVYPAVVEQFVVKPHELVKQSRYLQREIGATRSAFGISGAKVTAYPTSASPTSASLVALARQLGAEVAALPYLRLTGPPAGRANWVSTHLVYTHGFGVVAAAAGSAQANGDPSFTESGIPARGALGTFQPRVYFGPRETAYAIVGGPPGRAPIEFDYPTADTSAPRERTYHGGGGVPLGSITERLLYAIRFGDPHILLSSAVNRASRLLYVRDPLARVEKVAPFLTLDGDVYPVLTGGQILWVADGYTTTDSYPYAARYDATAATAGSAAPVGPGAGQINYIRNSVKAVVNAYTGQVTLYAWDASDPVLLTWMKAFPGLIRPRRAIPSSLLAHLRYPTGLFDIQRQVLATFHVQTPAAFYGGQDFWAVPRDPSGATPGSGPQPPAYLTMTMPGDPAPEFSIMTSFTPAGRPNMAAYLAVDSNPASPGYGTIRLGLPQNAAIAGPQQIQNAFESDPAAAAELAAARRGGSRVILGNLIALPVGAGPVGAGFLYVEPLYVEASAGGAAGSSPVLQKVLVSYGGAVGYGSTVPKALGGARQAAPAR